MAAGFNAKPDRAVRRTLYSCLLAFVCLLLLEAGPGTCAALSLCLGGVLHSRGISM
jgi:hypothetical protein